MDIINGLEIVPCMYDCNTVEFAVKDVATGRYVAEGCATVDEAERERDAYLAEMYRLNDGPFSAAQSQ